MSDTQPDMQLPTADEVVAAIGQETESTRVDHMMGMLSNLVEAEPTVSQEQRTEYEQGQLLHQTEQQLINMAVQDPTLVHSATAVFNELRYYDAMRLKAYAVDIYSKLVKVIGETPTVPLIVKKNLPVMSALSFPMMVDPNELPTKVTVAVHHKVPSVDVSITFEYRSGRANTFTTGTRYKKQ